MQYFCADLLGPWQHFSDFPLAPLKPYRNPRWRNSILPAPRARGIAPLPARSPEGPLSTPDGPRTSLPPALGSVPVVVVRTQGGTRPRERPPLPSHSRGGGVQREPPSSEGGRSRRGGRGARCAAAPRLRPVCVSVCLCVCERRAARPLPPLGVCPAPVLRDRAGRRRRRSVGAGSFLVRRRRNNAAPQPAGRELPPSAAGRCEGGAPLGPPLPPEPPALPPSPLSSPRPAHPRPAMPDQISVSEFVSETNEDYKSPTASNFTTRMAQCRNTVAAIEEVRRGAGSAAPRPGGGKQGATGAAGSRRSLPARPRAAPPAAGERKRGERGEEGGGRAAERLPPALGGRLGPAGAVRERGKSSPRLSSGRSTRCRPPLT